MNRMGIGDCYNLAHERIPMMEGAMLLNDTAARRIALDTIDSVEVSTVFLVFDHGHDGTPVLYETLVSGPEDVLWVERYSSRDAALAGHDRALAWVNAPHVADKPRVHLM